MKTAAFAFGLVVFFCIPSVATARGHGGINVKVATSAEVLALFEKRALPQYPYEARRAYTTGSGIFRMYIEPDGKVRTVGVMTSTGSKILDLAAAGGLYQWRAKPGHRREVDLPVRFTLSR